MSKGVLYSLIIILACIVPNMASADTARDILNRIDKKSPRSRTAPARSYDNSQLNSGKHRNEAYAVPAEPGNSSGMPQYQGYEHWPDNPCIKPNPPDHCKSLSR